MQHRLPGGDGGGRAPGSPADALAVQRRPDRRQPDARVLGARHGRQRADGAARELRQAPQAQAGLRARLELPLPAPDGEVLQEGGAVARDLDRRHRQHPVRRDRLPERLRRAGAEDQERAPGASGDHDRPVLAVRRHVREAAAGGGPEDADPRLRRHGHGARPHRGRHGRERQRVHDLRLPEQGLGDRAGSTRSSSGSSAPRRTAATRRSATTRSRRSRRRC